MHSFLSSYSYKPLSMPVCLTSWASSLFWSTLHANLACRRKDDWRSCSNLNLEDLSSLKTLISSQSSSPWPKLGMLAALDIGSCLCSDQLVVTPLRFFNFCHFFRHQFARSYKLFVLQSCCIKRTSLDFGIALSHFICRCMFSYLRKK